jgi:hypothetical protein
MSINPSSHIRSEFGNDPVWLEPEKLKFPVLEELVIPHVGYMEDFHGPLKLGHEWWNIVDWSRIMKLDVGEIGHKWSNFLVGRVAQVRSLSFDYSSWHANREQDAVGYVSNAKNLLRSITELHEVSCFVYAGRDDPNWAAIWDTLLLHHGKSLKKLGMKRQQFTTARAKLLIDQAPNLEELDVVTRAPALKKAVFDKDHGRIGMFQYEDVKALTRLSYLRRLKLTIPMGMIGMDYLGLMGYKPKPFRSPSDPKIIRNRDCEQQIGPIFEAFLTQQAQSCKIDTIEVQFDCEDEWKWDSAWMRSRNNCFMSWKAIMQRNYTAALGNGDGKPYSIRFQIVAGDLVQGD